MNVFISGGCKNGKSYYAQRVAKDMADDQKVPLYYLATMRPSDDEDRARITKHIEDRDGWGFETVEQPENICSCLADESTSDAEAKVKANPKGSFLLDSVTALLSNEMFRVDGTIDLDAPKRVAEDLKNFAAKTGNTVFVSDYIYSDALKYDELTESYRKGLAYIDRELAKICDQVIEVAYSQIIRHK